MGIQPVDKLKPSVVKAEHVEKLAIRILVWVRLVERLELKAANKSIN